MRRVRVADWPTPPQGRGFGQKAPPPGPPVEVRGGFSRGASTAFRRLEHDGAQVPLAAPGLVPTGFREPQAPRRAPGKKIERAFLFYRKRNMVTSVFACRSSKINRPAKFPAFIPRQAAHWVLKPADLVAPGHSPSMELPRCRPRTPERERCISTDAPVALSGVLRGWKAWRAGALCRLDSAFHPLSDSLLTFCSHRK